MNTKTLIVGVMIAVIAIVAAGADSNSAADEAHFSIQEIPRDGFESLEALKQFATSWPGKDRLIESRQLIECTIGKNQAWVLVRSFGASASLMEVAIFTQSMWRYRVNIWIPATLVSLSAEPREDGTLDIYKYSNSTHGKELVLSVRELVGVAQP